MTTDPMDEDMPERKNEEIERSLELLVGCLAMIHAMLERSESRQRMQREEASLRASQYPCDEYGEMFYDEEFKFDWL
tara:strand:+ start:9404 stop:9634 length:231 start_codon:yes stop_codon:yes gene_type:complete